MEIEGIVVFISPERVLILALMPIYLRKKWTCF
jgi:hypothetical protein